MRISHSIYKYLSSLHNNSYYRYVLVVSLVFNSVCHNIEKASSSCLVLSALGTFRQAEPSQKAINKPQIKSFCLVFTQFMIWSQPFFCMQGWFYHLMLFQRCRNTALTFQSNLDAPDRNKLKIKLTSENKLKPSKRVPTIFYSKF